MKDTEGNVVRLEDYTSYGWRLEGTELSFDLYETETLVESKVQFTRDVAESSTVRLHGEELELLDVSIDGRKLTNNEYSVDAEGLNLFDVPSRFELTTKVRIHPESNTKLEGLYKSSSLFCTQCEAESFRRITYYPDRPDVSSVFTTRIEADKKDFPELLSNGNRIEYEELANGRHRATWQDPFPKPSYLFALVAGNLSSLEDTFTTMSGREVRLTIFSEPHNIDKCSWAMQSLKLAMKWDEEVYGREYDLERFMIVAVDDFNFGAMENKGLNIFNVSALLASPDTATDGAYQRIAGIIAHEYFHNWSGNRVTCRDWFQLSLKEGFTVFRDTQFSESLEGETSVRIDTVAGLRAGQFPEDAGKLAHPVRPDQYAAITNFYTATIYQKGAEVLRMMYTMAGKEKWRRATDLYFERHDGSAATIEDFVASVSDATELDLEQFFRWYVQAGTPRLKVVESRDGEDVELRISQSCPATPNQPTKQPFHIPIAIGMISADGSEILGAKGSTHGYVVNCDSPMKVENPNSDGTLILHLREGEESVKFGGVPSDAAVSFLRGFSAPVYVDYAQDMDSLRTLALFDTDGFTRWNAVQSLYSRHLVGQDEAVDTLTDLVRKIVERLVDADDGSEEKSILASSLVLPSPLTVLQAFPGSDFDELDERRDSLSLHISKELQRLWEKLLVHHPADSEYSVTGEAINRRRARHIALANLRRASSAEHPVAIANLLADGFRAANNLSDRLANVAQLLELPEPADDIKREVLSEFHERFCNEPLVIDQWFRLQATCSLPNTLQSVRELEQHDSFSFKNPNRVRSLIGAFAMGNLKNFHNRDGSGYSYIAEKVVELEATNPQVASRLATELTQWVRFGEERQQLMKESLRYIEERMTSNSLRDVVTRGLAD